MVGSTYNSKQLNEPSVIGVGSYYLGFQLELRMDIVKVPSCLDRIIPQSQQRIVGLLISSLLHIPTRRFRTEIYSKNQWHCWDESTAKLKSPSDLWNICNNKVGAETQEYSKSCPHLPTHDEGPSDSCRRVLSGKYWYRTRFRAHSHPKKNATYKALHPRLRKSSSKHREETKVCRHEYRSASPEETVKWIGKPAAYKC